MKQKREHLRPAELLLKRSGMSAMELSRNLGLGSSTVGSWVCRNGKIPNRGDTYMNILALAGRERFKITLEELVRGGSL